MLPSYCASITDPCPLIEQVLENGRSRGRGRCPDAVQSRKDWVARGRARARRGVQDDASPRPPYRKRLDELGSVSGPVIDGHVRDRLRSGQTANTLPPAQADLADEIVAFLRGPRLTAHHQAAELERDFLGP